MADTRACSFWLQVRPVWSRWYPGSLMDLRAVRITKRKPSRPEEGCALIHVTLDIPEATFVPREQSVQIAVSPGQLQVVPVTGRAEEAADDQPG